MLLARESGSTDRVKLALRDGLVVVVLAANLLPQDWTAVGILAFAVLALLAYPRVDWSPFDIAIISGLLLPVYLHGGCGPLLINGKPPMSYAIAVSVFLAFKLIGKTGLEPALVAFCVIATIGVGSGLSVWLPKVLLFRSFGICDPLAFRRPLAFFIPAAHLGNPICLYLACMGLSVTCIGVCGRSRPWLAACSLLSLSCSELLCTLSFSRAAIFVGLLLLLCSILYGRRSDRAKDLQLSVALSTALSVLAHCSLKTIKYLGIVLSLLTRSSQRRSAFGHWHIISKEWSLLGHTGFLGIGSGCLSDRLQVPQGFNAFLEYGIEHGYCGLAILVFAGYWVVRANLVVFRRPSSALGYLVFSLDAILVYSLVWSNLLFDKASLVSLGVLCALVSSFYQRLGFGNGNTRDLCGGYQNDGGLAQVRHQDQP